MDDVVSFFRSIWGLWLMAIFIGIVVWVMWPSRSKRFERQRQIPLNDDQPFDDGRKPNEDAGKGN